MTREGAPMGLFDLFRGRKDVASTGSSDGLNHVDKKSHSDGAAADPLIRRIDDMYLGTDFHGVESSLELMLRYVAPILDAEYGDFAQGSGPDMLLDMSNTVDFMKGNEILVHAGDSAYSGMRRNCALLDAGKANKVEPDPVERDFTVQTMRDYFLMRAIVNENVRDARRALGRGARVDSPCMYRGTLSIPIVEAAARRSQDLVDLLLEAGANADAGKSNGETALAYASQNGDYNIASSLLEAGADPNKSTPVGPPLAIASNIAIMALLIEHGADVDKPDRDGDTPIVGAICSVNPEAAFFLRMAGSSLDHRNRAGKTPLDHASGVLMRRALSEPCYERPMPSVNLSDIRDEVCDRIARLRCEYYPPSAFCDERILRSGETISDAQRNAWREISSIKRAAIDAKRGGDLQLSNDCYIEAFKAGEVFDADVLWGWFKTLLLAKNFRDARLVLKYKCAADVRYNIYWVESGHELGANVGDSGRMIDFDGFVAFADHTHTFPYDKADVERRIRGFGGSPRWDGYRLDTDEFDAFLRCFGVDDFYTTERYMQLAGEKDADARRQVLEHLVASGEEFDAPYALAGLIEGEEPARARQLYLRALAANNGAKGAAEFSRLVEDSDAATATQLFEQAIACGDEYYSTYRLAQLIKGEEPERAKRLFDRSIAAGDERASTYELALLLLDDNRERAVSLLERSVAAGNVFYAGYVLAQLVEGEDAGRAESLYERVISAGDERGATKRLADLVRQRDPERAKTLYRRSIAAGDAYGATYGFALLLQEDSPEGAEALLEQSVAAGNERDATNFLAELIKDRDPERARSLYERAIAAGDERYATGNLALLLREEDPYRARSLCERAMAAGSDSEEVLSLLELLTEGMHGADAVQDESPSIPTSSSLSNDSAGVPYGTNSATSQDAGELDERVLRDVTAAYIRQGARHTNGDLGSTVYDCDICVVDESGVVHFFDPETGEEYTGADPKAQAQAWVDSYNKELDEAFRKTCEDYRRLLIDREGISDGTGGQGASG